MKTEGFQKTGGLEVKPYCQCKQQGTEAATEVFCKEMVLKVFSNFKFRKEKGCVGVSF